MMAEIGLVCPELCFLELLKFLVPFLFLSNHACFLARLFEE